MTQIDTISIIVEISILIVGFSTFAFGIWRVVHSRIEQVRSEVQSVRDEANNHIARLEEDLVHRRDFDKWAAQVERRLDTVQATIEQHNNQTNNRLDRILMMMSGMHRHTGDHDK